MNNATSIRSPRFSPQRDNVVSLLAALAIFLFGASALRASTYTWDGGGSGPSPTYFSDANNWNYNAVPPAGSDIVLGSGFASGRLIYVTSGHAFTKLTFNPNAYNVDLSYGFGNPLIALTTGAIDCSANNVTIHTPLWLTKLGTWKVNGTLKIAGTMTGPADPGFLSALAKSGSGTLVLAGTNTTKIPTVWLQAGTLRLGSTTALPTTCSLLAYRYGTYTNPMVEIATGLNPTIGGLVVEDATIYGEYNSGLSISSAFLQDGTEIDVPLHGTADLDVEANATVGLRRSGTFTGTITLGANSSLHIDSNGCLGNAANDIVVDSGEAALVSDYDETLGPSRVLYIASGTQLDLFNFEVIRASVNGGGVLSIRGNATVDLRANNSAFTGLIDRDGGNLIADSYGSLGNAYRINLNGTGDLILDTSTAAFSEPDLNLGEGGKLIPQDNSEDFGELIVNTSHVTIQFHPTGATDHAVLTFEDILLPTSVSASANLTITGWTGMPGQPGTDDRIFSLDPVSSTELKNIKFANFPVSGAIRLASGEIVPAVP